MRLVSEGCGVSLVLIRMEPEEGTFLVWKAKEEELGRGLTAAAADAIVVGLRARDLQDWLVQVAHFILS